MHPIVAQISPTSQYGALVAGIMAVLWLLIICFLHLIKPQLNPSTRMISEYAMKPKGWIMQTAFFCMAASCFSLALAIWPLFSHVGPILLAIVGLGFSGAGAFVTDPLSTTRGSQTRGGILHNIFSLIAVLLFPITATVLGISISANGIWAGAHIWPSILSMLTWVGTMGFIASGIYSAKHPSRPVAGYFQRFMALTFAVYLIAIAVYIFWSF